MKRLKARTKQVITHPLISNSSVLFLGSIFSNTINLLFTLFMSRNLSLAEWGIFARIVSLTAIPLYASSAITPTVVNFAAGYYAKGELGKARGLYKQVSILSIGFGLFVCVLFIFFNGIIQDFFKLNSFWYIVLIGLTVLISYASAVNTSFLQAKLSFTYISITNFVSVCIKLITGVLLVLLGFSVAGAISGYLFGVIIVLILTFFPLKELFSRHTKTVKIGVTQLLHYGGAAGISVIALTSFISTDILLAGRFFSKEEAGLYSGLSLLGRTIFFLTAPISTVVFPLVSQRVEENKPHHKLIMLAVFIVFAPSAALTILYSLFPKFFILFFLKQESYLKISEYVPYFCIFILLYSLLYLFVNYFLSMKKTNVFIPVLAGAIFQLVGIFLYHKNFLEMIMVSLLITLVLLVGLLVYFFLGYGKRHA